MNTKSLRRLATDHAQLHSSLPPNYLFPLNHNSDDLTTLTVLLAGPDGTPYSNGLFTLTLHIPLNYPTAPPTAAFKTRIWHPNVEEATGKVCVETLKRDWEAKLKLYDVLVTISCLLIQPNPASALNADAGMALERGWAVFEKRARMMTGIHACVPKELMEAWKEAKARGEGLGEDDVEEDLKRKRKGKAPVSIVRVEEVMVKPVDGEEENTQSFSQGKVDSSMESANLITTAVSQAPKNVLGITGISKATDSGCDLRASLNSEPTTIQTSHQILSGEYVPPLQQTTTTPLSPTPISPHLFTPIKQPPPPSEVLTPCGKPLPEPVYLNWYKELMVEHTPDRLARQKADHRRLKAAGWNLDLYNRGVMGGIREKRGLKRL